MNRAERRRQEKLKKKGFKTVGNSSQNPQLQIMLESAVQSHNNGNISEAEDLYNQVLAIDPDQPVALHLLGLVAHHKGQNDIAKNLISKAVAIRPDYTVAVFSLANVLQSMNRFDQAVLRYHQVLKQQPDHAGALNNLASTLDRMGKPEDAIPYLNQAIQAAPQQVDSYKNLGILYKKINRAADALAPFSKARELDPKNPEHLFNMADSHQMLDNFDQAIANFKKVLEITPENGAAHYRLAILYEKLHKLAEAEQHGKQAVSLSPDDPMAGYPLAVVLRRQGQIEDALRILEPASRQALAGNMASSVHFELGTLYDRSGNTQQAFSHFVTSNEIEASATTADKHRFLAKIEAQKEVAGKWKDHWPPTPEPARSDAPVFIVGFPRSGTTLLDQVLDAHPDIQVMEEQPAIRAVINAYPGSYPDGIADLADDDISRLRQVYFDFVDQTLTRRPGVQFIDKLPLNIVEIPLIARLFPEAKLLLAMRHPCDVILSNFMQLFVLNDAMANFLTLQDAAHCYSEVMGLWGAYEESLPLNWHLVKYEAMISDLEGEARRLLKYLDIPWNSAVLDPATHAKSRGRINTPSYQSVTEPLYQRAKGRWERYQEHLDPMLEPVKPFVKKFGYET